jgi:hypothetical protein
MPFEITKKDLSVVAKAAKAAGATGEADTIGKFNESLQLIDRILGRAQSLGIAAKGNGEQSQQQNQEPGIVRIGTPKKNPTPGYVSQPPQASDTEPKKKEDNTMIAGNKEVIKKHFKDATAFYKFFLGFMESLPSDMTLSELSLMLESIKMFPNQEINAGDVCLMLKAGKKQTIDQVQSQIWGAS